MRIKKLELIGFKSFKDRTVIQFDAGITGVVGPNGCGKSNIVDGLLWVMGEMSAKDLRGSTMTDVIFAGSEGYAPMGMAEVSLVLENDGGPFPAKYASHSEVMVTRRLHRSGESEYFINKEVARLKDIQEIFMDTGAGSKGFSIIQQGMIGKIITSKPEDRRHLIEEAAGITKFKARKKESQRKLLSTEQNLLRLADIVGELKRQIDSLQRQSQRAEKYRGLKTEIEELDLAVAAEQFVGLKTEAESSQKIYQEMQSLDIESGANSTSMQADLESKKLLSLELEKQIDSQQAQSQELNLKIRAQEFLIQELKFEIEQARRQEVMTGSLAAEQTARKELLEREEQELQIKLESLREELHTVREQHAEKSEKFQNINSEVIAIDDELTLKRRELFAVGQSLSAIEAKLQALVEQSSRLAEQVELAQVAGVELKEKMTDLEDRRRALLKKFDQERQLQMDLSSDVDSFEANKKTLTDSLNERRIETDEFKDKLNEVSSRLYGLENLQANFEGFEEGVKQVMLWQKTKATEITADGGVHYRPVSEVLEVQGSYEVALQAALGSRLQMLLSSDSQKSLEAVDYLKNSKSGRSSFWTGASSEAIQSASAPQSGVVSLMRSQVTCSEQYAPVVDQLLSQIAVVDSLQSGLRLREEFPDWSFVTLDGDSISKEGVLTGGNAEGVENALLKRQREIKELIAAKAEWSGKHALAQALLKKTQEQLENVVNDFEGAQKRRLDQELKVSELKKDLERAESEISAAQVSIERHNREWQRLQTESQALQDKISEFESNANEQRITKVELESSARELEKSLETVKASIGTLQTESTDLAVALARVEQETQTQERHFIHTQSQLQELNQKLSLMSEASEKNTVVLTDGQMKLEIEKLELEKNLRAAQELQQQISTLTNDYQVHLNSQNALSEQLNQARLQKNEWLSKMNESQLRFEQAKMKEQYLVDQMRERYGVHLGEAFERYLGKVTDLVQTETELKDLRDKLSRLGEVNLSSIQEYQETSERYAFLTQQQADLTEAKEQLRKVIDRINKICAKRFKETFELVNERFTKVFPVLFGGGEARLEMIEDPEKGEIGIDIIAKPPGKKMQNVSLLSGGEKALTAVSLVFSIFLVKPSPYCLLDEVDAPLDDANVSRFNDLVREMSKRSQIIVVTHNKYTMEVASKLYGVTMQERGVSTMVSVNLQDL